MPKSGGEAVYLGDFAVPAASIYMYCGLSFKENGAGGTKRREKKKLDVMS